MSARGLRRVLETRITNDRAAPHVRVLHAVYPFSNGTVLLGCLNKDLVFRPDV